MSHRGTGPKEGQFMLGNYDAKVVSKMAARVVV